MNIALQDKQSVRSLVSEAEWATRIELAAFYRAVDMLGLTEQIYNHISARVPDADDQLLLNPFGLDYSEITASSLVKVDFEGNVILPSPTGYDFNYAGFVIHSAVHRARHDLICVAHTHSDAGTAVSTHKSGLLPITQNALRYIDDVAYHDYEGVAVDLDERERLVQNLGTKNNMILRNHGLLACGRSIAEAYLNLYNLEKAFRIQVQALACGDDLIEIDPRAIARNREIYSNGRVEKPTNGYTSDMEWAAMRRKIDRLDDSYAL